MLLSLQCQCRSDLSCTVKSLTAAQSPRVMGVTVKLNSDAVHLPKGGKYIRSESDQLSNLAMIHPSRP